jgi:hypothetical protein
MAIRSTSPVVGLTAHLSDGTSVELRRVPYILDTFICRQGHALRLHSLTQRLNNGRRSTRYGTYSLMTANLMADTYLPGWEDYANAALRFLDGSPMNCSLENLQPYAKKKRIGRPPNNIFKRSFEALAILEATLDFKLACAETRTPREMLMKACEAVNPDLYRTVFAIQNSGAKLGVDRFALKSSLGESFEEARVSQKYNDRVLKQWELETGAADISGGS